MRQSHAMNPKSSPVWIRRHSPPQPIRVSRTAARRPGVLPPARLSFSSDHPAAGAPAFTRPAGPPRVRVRRALRPCRCLVPVRLGRGSRTRTSGRSLGGRPQTGPRQTARVRADTDSPPPLWGSHPDPSDPALARKFPSCRLGAGAPDVWRTPSSSASTGTSRMCSGRQASRGPAPSPPAQGARSPQHWDARDAVMPAGSCSSRPAGAGRGGRVRTTIPRRLREAQSTGAVGGGTEGSGR